MSRKAALLATASSSSQLKKEGLASPEKQGLDSWAAKIQDNISSIRKGNFHFFWVQKEHNTQNTGHSHSQPVHA